MALGSAPWLDCKGLAITTLFCLTPWPPQHCPPPPEVLPEFLGEGQWPWHVTLFDFVLSEEQFFPLLGCTFF